MRVAIIGGGVSGLTAAHYLSCTPGVEVTLYEANDYIGGHTDTHEVSINGENVSVDTGFIVFNEHNYPQFTRLLRSLGVAWQDTDMSFSAVNERSGMEYGAEGFKRLFAQKRNLINPSFYRMLWDLMRFYRQTPSVLSDQQPDCTLGEYLKTQSYSKVFVENHILPMASALWSAPTDTVAQFPLKYFIAFMHNHRMLQLEGRPQWKTICGGSRRYVDEIVRRCTGEIRTSCPVTDVSRSRSGVRVTTQEYGSEKFDKVIFACHSDQALGLLKEPTDAEIDILGAIHYQKNRVVLHTDARYMPKNRAAWASWNARVSDTLVSHCSVSYWMNLLQGLDCDRPLIVTLNPAQNGAMALDPECVLAKRTYHHPVYTHQTLAAQQRRDEINGVNNTFYCGAYWGWGFHEDGVTSALDCINRIQRGDQHVAA
ncbi:FAD-dependent oxidoreductase [Ketobacter sp. MCCC 1A13808]|uniref:NAD(P)/FAD-dependent oxidoreductase n=1 Tax=Ketobacter sp. MCCC 1A13808 TaxID=2602738 RepID=UPI0012EC2931|nr:FAD-dependent oxidoreductase [Ketobacter sp. MCCC 1A13808]MVF13229.1 FAD-dependent oxidoreductase [Ketobacter sp. MCCC 1A13808]